MIESCDPVTGMCKMPEATGPQTSKIEPTTPEWSVRYIGDPMCSWCWGISPMLKELEKYCANNQLGFSISVGGLRPGGGDRWDDHFKNFLRNEWTHIGQVTGQAFGFTLLEQDLFNYDTEPACRAVITAREIIEKNGLPKENNLSFFSAIQRKFYVLGQDPKNPEFYQDICQEQQIPYADFASLFQTKEISQKTLADFNQCRSWGVRGFPSILLQKGNHTNVLASGFVTLEALVAKIAHAQNH